MGTKQLGAVPKEQLADGELPELLHALHRIDVGSDADRRDAQIKYFYNSLDQLSEEAEPVTVATADWAGYVEALWALPAGSAIRVVPPETVRWPVVFAALLELERKERRRLERRRRRTRRRRRSVRRLRDPLTAAWGRAVGIGAMLGAWAGISATVVTASVIGGIEPTEWDALVVSVCTMVLGVTVYMMRVKPEWLLVKRPSGAEELHGKAAPDQEREDV